MSKSKKISGSALSVIILLVFIWTVLPTGSSGKKVYLHSTIPLMKAMYLL